MTREYRRTALLALALAAGPSPRGVQAQNFTALQPQWAAAAASAPLYNQLSAAALTASTGCAFLEGAFVEQFQVLNTTRWNTSSTTGLDHCPTPVRSCGPCFPVRRPLMPFVP